MYPSISAVLRRIGVAAACVAIAGSLAAPAGAATLSDHDRGDHDKGNHDKRATAARHVARVGAGWLADQIGANGGHLNSFGLADPANTAYAVVGLRAAGVGRTASKQAITYLETQLGAATQNDDGSDNPGVLGYYILAAVSARVSPYRFGGHAPENNLVARLLGTQRTSGPDAGLFGSEDPTYDGAFRQGLALDALKAARVARSDRRVRRADRWLIRQQCSNGLWLGYRADVTVACPSVDPATFSGPDTNSTAMAMQGLAADRLFPRRHRALTSLRAAQSADGGFPFLAASGLTSDPDSTALTLQALIAVGVRPSTWRKGSATPESALAAYQLGCAAPAADRGAFYYPGDQTPSVLATVQAVPAAAGLPLSRVHARQVTKQAPDLTCSTSTSTAFRTPSGGTTQVHELLTAATIASTSGPCKGTSGVTVSVDFGAWAKGIRTRCAPGTPSTGVAALQQAGFTVAGTAQYGLAFVCRINSLPTTTQQKCLRTPPATAYWAYYYANAGKTTWTYSATGAASFKPAQGSIQAWTFGNSAKPRKTPAQIRAGL